MVLFMVKFFYSLGLIFFIVKCFQLLTFKGYLKKSHKFVRYLLENKEERFSSWDIDMKNKTYFQFSLVTWLVIGILSSHWLIFIALIVSKFILHIMAEVFNKVNFMYGLIKMVSILTEIFIIGFIVINSFHLHFDVSLNHFLKLLNL